MTGLPNYLAYREEAEKLQSEARRTGTPVAVVFLDLDKFGTINKTFSWDRGTRALTAVARGARVRVPGSRPGLQVRRR